MIAGVIGAAGYAGAELVRLLSGHKRIKSLSLGTVSLEGERIENVYPNFLGKVSCPLVKPEEVIAASDIVFSALPHGVGECYAKACLERGISFIDLSADFRFGEDEGTFKAWYGKPYVYPKLRERSVYGLPELNRERIKALAASGPLIIANPGCYPTGATLGILPAQAEGLALPTGTIIVDSASGVTGGGREPQRSFHFPECSDSMTAYKVGTHRHQPEISRNLQAIAELSGRPTLPLIFTPHLAPMNRGILSTIYIPIKAIGVSCMRSKLEDIWKLHAQFYEGEPFVRVLPQGFFASTGRVRHSNFCDISVHLDPTADTLIVVTAIDNMVKGAAGQAVQNMNLVFGFEENEGLEAIPALF